MPGFQEVRKLNSNIWKVPAYLPYVHEPISKQSIHDAEKRLGVALPRAYLELLAAQNGGYVRRTLPDLVHSMIWGIGPRFPSITDSIPSELHRWSRRQRRFWQKTLPLLPFDGDGHWYLCLDYRSGAPEPRVTYVDLETEEEQLVAGNFKNYLSLLQPKLSSNAMGISGNWTEISAAQALGEALGVAFENQGDWAYGYPVSCAALGTEDDPQWRWLSPNLVPRGFVRKNDQRFNELNGRLPGMALRFLEFPDVTVEISCTDEVLDSVHEAGMRCFKQLVPLA